MKEQKELEFSKETLQEVITVEPINVMNALQLREDNVKQVYSFLGIESTAEDLNGKKGIAVDLGGKEVVINVGDYVVQCLGMVLVIPEENFDHQFRIKHDGEIEQDGWTDYVVRSEKVKNGVCYKILMNNDADYNVLKYTKSGKPEHLGVYPRLKEAKDRVDMYL